MKVDKNPYQPLNDNITPTEFEVFCKKTLEGYAKSENLSNFSITHNKRVPTYDGTYQIDVIAEYTALGARNIVLIECKKRGARLVKRDEAMLLYQKLQSIGANKGILMSTTGFQKGAITFAKAHGLTLWQVCDNSVAKVMNSADGTDKLKLQLLASQYLPKYCVMEWDYDLDYPVDQIYPTKEMRQAAIEKAKESCSD